MPQKTNLNVAPYYDDFNESDNFVRTLFRPGFAIQARELTQLQSVLQNQMEQGFSHLFTDGTVIIPGQVTYSGGKDALRFVKLQPTISGETVELDQFVDADNPVIITGKTSGIKFMVIKVEAATSSDPPTLFGHYVTGNLQGTKEDFDLTADTRNLLAREGEVQPLDAAGFDKFVVNVALIGD